MQNTPLQVHPFQRPTIEAGQWVKSILLRMGVPAAVFLIVILGTTNHEGAALYRAMFASFLIVIGLIWVGHWRYAQWRELNKSNELAGPVISLWRFLFLALILFWCMLGYAIDAVMHQSPGAAAVSAVAESFAPAGRMMWESGLLASIALIAVLRATTLVWRVWASHQEASEAMWWVDQAVRAALAALALVAAIGLIVALCKNPAVRALFSWTSIYDGDLRLQGSWLDETGAAAGQLASAGAWRLFALTVIVRSLWQRHLLRSDVRSEVERTRVERLRQEKDVDALTPTREVPSMRTYAEKRLNRLVSILGWALFAVTTACVLVALANPAAGLTGFQYAGPLVIGLFEAGPELPAAIAGLALIELMLAAESRWNDHTRGRHGFLNFLAKLVLYAGVVGCAYLAVQAVTAEEQIYGRFTAYFQLALQGAAQPSVWMFAVQAAARTALYILGIAIGLYFLIEVITGGGGAGAGGGGSYGGGSFSSSAGDAPSKQVVNDRYGRKLVTIENEGIFGTTVRDRYGRKVGEASQDVFGNERVRTKSGVYDVRDALLSKDKIVSKDGKNVGRTTNGMFGDRQFHDE